MVCEAAPTHCSSPMLMAEHSIKILLLLSNCFG
jgi:hypothetical protein